MSGDFNRRITRFEDQVKVCETIWVVLTEVAKIFYFMNNLNDSIFGTVKANFMELSTRVLFPETYDEIKQMVIAEYGQVTQRRPQTVLKLIKCEDAKRYGEATFKAEEEGCHLWHAGTFLPIVQTLQQGFFRRGEPQLFHQEPEEEG